jgi:L-alanine-DL-glutamate epimerase-like enolase superfamily enzyme
VVTRFAPERARTPIKFGAVVMDDALHCAVGVRVENRAGAVADGWGAIFLADFWAFPDPAVGHRAREGAMRAVVDAYAGHVAERYGRPGAHAHPVDIWLETQDELRRLGERAASGCGLGSPLPWLACLVGASAVDAALHDAFGRAAGLPAYRAYGREHLGRDLATLLAPALGARAAAPFRGAYPADFLRPQPVPAVEVFHLVGGLDKLTRGEVDEHDPEDGLPRCLEEWIERDGLSCLKVKLTGYDVGWDVERTVAVARVARETHAGRGRGGAQLALTADANEQSPGVEAAVEYLRRLQERDPAAYAALRYLEQPTSRDLVVDPIDVRPIAALKPVVGDECVADLATAERALALGWSGLALKTCKGQSFCVLALARAAAAGIPYTVQDLTNPGLALLQSVGLAAWSHPLTGVEYNSRQFFPHVAPAVRRAHPDVFTVRDGRVGTGSLAHPGLGYRPGLLGPVGPVALAGKRVVRVPV